MKIAYGGNYSVETSWLDLIGPLARKPMSKDIITFHGRHYAHKECLFDFAGNNSQPGCWADLWQGQSGIAITFGGCWTAYFPRIRTALDAIQLEWDDLGRINWSAWHAQQYKIEHSMTYRDTFIGKEAEEAEAVLRADKWTETILWLQSKSFPAKHPQSTETLIPDVTPEVL